MLIRGGYRIRNQKEVHFITFAVVEWVDVFTRSQYGDIFLDSLQFCQREKGLFVHCYCLMSNHVHLILSAADENLSDIIRDFKKFTSKQILSAIQNDPQESRREWMLRIFSEQGAGNLRNKAFQFWQQDNRPMELYSPRFTVQKLDYIHQNPVRAGIVERSEDYLCSSAWNYKHHKQRGRLEISFL